MDKLFHDLERLLELEALIADCEVSCRELEEEIEYEKDELRYAKIQRLSLESPDFFLRLMPARLEKKKELAQTEVRSHTTALEKAKRDLELKNHALGELKKEYEVLLPRREEYAAGRGSFPAELEQHLICAEGIQLAQRILFSLEKGANYMRGDALRGNDKDGDTTLGQHVRGSRKMEFLSAAAQDAKKLREVLDRLPTPIQINGSYLSWPDHYITEPTSVYAQMDRQNMAVDTVRDVRRQLREFL